MVESKYFSIFSMFKMIGHVLNPVLVYKYKPFLFCNVNEAEGKLRTYCMCSLIDKPTVSHMHNKQN